MGDYRIEQVKVDSEALKESQDLLQQVFKEHADKFSFDYLRWQYAENPAGPIVGFNAYLRGGKLRIIFKYPTICT